MKPIIIPDLDKELIYFHTSRDTTAYQIKSLQGQQLYLEWLKNQYDKTKQIS